MDWTGRGFGLSKVGLGQHELAEFKSTGPSPCPMEAWTILRLSGRNDESYLVA